MQNFHGVAYPRYAPFWVESMIFNFPGMVGYEWSGQLEGTTHGHPFLWLAKFWPPEFLFGSKILLMATPLISHRIRSNAPNIALCYAFKLLLIPSYLGVIKIPSGFQQSGWGGAGRIFLAEKHQPERWDKHLKKGTRNYAMDDLVEPTWNSPELEIVLLGLH